MVFDLTRKGETENIRVRDTTHECFNETAITAVRSWRYKARRVGNVSVAQEDLEVTFKFVLEHPTEAFEFDARPISRVPPRYPERCMRSAKNYETVLVRFDVTETGETANAVVAESSNRCLERPALESVRKWKYSPKLIDGQPVERKNVETLISFVLDGGGVGSHEFRSGVRSGLLRAQNLAIKDKSVERAITVLEEVEQKYGDSFSKTELSSFHQVRAAVRIESGDYAGALDDLRIARGLGVGTADAAEAIDATIVQLEAALGITNSTAQDEPDEDVGDGGD